MKLLENWKDPQERRGVFLVWLRMIKYVALAAILCAACVVFLYRGEAFQERVRTAVLTMSTRGRTGGDKQVAATETEPETKQEEGFIFPDSDSRLLTEEELEAMTVEELAIARNELYARRGRVFSGKWGEYFGGKDWYEPLIPGDQFDEEAIFNQFEKANRDMIVRTERKRKK